MTVTRCSHPDCKKKLTIINSYSCRCNSLFCDKHRLPELHNCTFNNKNYNKSKLIEKMKSNTNKMIKI